MIHAFKSTLEESLAADLILLLIDASEKLEDIRIKYKSCWNVLNELKVDKSRVFTILTKCDDGVIGLSDLIENIGNNLGLSNPIALSAKTGYGIYKLKTMIGRKLYSQYLSGRHHSTEVTRAQGTDTSIITANIHT
jgi:GTPase